MKQLSKPLECSHLDTGACLKCRTPRYGLRPWAAVHSGPKRAVPDQWWLELLHEYARVAGMGAAESPILEV